MRQLWLVLALIGCSDKSETAKPVDTSPVAKMTAFKDQMCACTDKACAMKVSDDMMKWSEDLAKSGSGADNKDVIDIGVEVGKCMQKAIKPGSMP